MLTPDGNNWHGEGGFGIIKDYFGGSAMPIYEYKCRKCGEVCEILQKMMDPSPKSCPACGGPLEKILSCPAIQFKGSGWYITDYARKNSAPSRVQKPSSQQDKNPSAEKTKKPATEVRPSPKPE